jgi:hypothetical protein
MIRQTQAVKSESAAVACKQPYTKAHHAPYELTPDKGAVKAL